MKFDAQRAILKGPNLFKPFRVTGEGVPLKQAGLKSDEILLVFERNRQRQAFLRREMIYPHVAQGQLDGQPYLVTF